MSKKLTQDEVNNIVWRACDSFRGSIESTEYKNYILVMLFVKYISDVWQDHYAKLEKQYKGDKVRIERRLARERFVLSGHANFNFLYENRDHPRKPKIRGKGYTNCESVGEMINIALEEIELSNKTKLANVFRNIDFNDESRLGDTKKRNRILAHLLEDFNQLDLRPSRIGKQDVIGDAYEYLIARFAADAGRRPANSTPPARFHYCWPNYLLPNRGIASVTPPAVPVHCSSSAPMRWATRITASSARRRSAAPGHLP